MSAETSRASVALLGTATLLLAALAHAEPTNDQSEPAPARSEQAETAQGEPADNHPQPAKAHSEKPPAEPTRTDGATGAKAAPPPRPISLGASPTPAVSSDSDDGPQTLFGSRRHPRIGGYGGVDVAYTRVAGKDAVLTCGAGALLVDHSLAFGFMGCGMPSRVSGMPYGNVTHEIGDRLEFGYGGAVAGYHFFPKELYNLSLSVMVGGGGISVVNRDGPVWQSDDHVKTTDALFVAEPRIAGYLNLTRWARVGAFVGYRFVAGVDTRNLSAADLSGPVAGGSIQFGWF